MISKTRTIFIYFTSLLLSQNIHSVEPNTVVATITVGVTPDGLAITPDSRYAYVANNNNYGLPGGDTVSVLDLSNNTCKTTISDPSFNEPFTVTINPAGTKAYITNSNGTTITIIDIASNTVLGTIGGFDGPSGMTINSLGTIGYVNNYGAPGGAGSGNATTVRVVDLVANTIIGSPITVGLAPAALAITPDDAFVYVINYEDGNPGTGTISVIQTSNNTVVATIPGFSGPFGIAITPNGKYAYIANFGSNNFTPIGTTVSVVDLTSNTITATINLGIQPSGIAITPDGRFAYATNANTLYTNSVPNPPPTPPLILAPGQGIVNIIDIATNQVIPPMIAVGQAPDHIAISPNGEFAYVANFISNTVDVIALQSFQITAEGCQTSSKFLTYTDYINKLTWNVTGTSLPLYYSIYRDALLTDLAGTVLASEPLEFYDHNRIPGVSYTYYLVGTNAVGTTSNPVVVTVTSRCR